MTVAAREKTIWDVDPTSVILQKIYYKFITKRLKSFSVISENRHEGKTTVSVLIARGLSEVYGLKVLFVDLNPEGDSLLNLYLKDTKTENGIIENHHFPFAIFRMKNLEIDWARNIFDGLYLNRMLTYFSAQYDLVIVDTMSSQGLADTYLKLNTDSSLIVSTDHSLKLQENKLASEIKKNRKNILGIVYNR